MQDFLHCIQKENTNHSGLINLCNLLTKAPGKSKHDSQFRWGLIQQFKDLSSSPFAFSFLPRAPLGGSSQLYAFFFWSENSSSSCRISIFSTFHSQKRQCLCRYLFLMSWGFLSFSLSHWLEWDQCLRDARKVNPQNQGEDQPRLNHMAEIGVQVSSPNEKQVMIKRNGENGYWKGNESTLCNGNMCMCGWGAEVCCLRATP